MQSRIVTAVSGEWERSIRAVASGRQVVACTNVPSLLHCLETGVTGIVFIDPAMICDERTIADLCGAFAQRRIVRVFCTTLAAESMQATIVASELSPDHVLVAEQDLHPSVISSVLTSETNHGVARDIANALNLQAPRCPHRLMFVIQRLLRRPETYFSAEDVARHAGMSRRNVDRHLAAIGIASARRLVVAVRALHAIDRITTGGRSITAAAESLGYANRTVLVRNIKVVCGRATTALGDGLQNPDVRAAARRFIAVANTPCYGRDAACASCPAVALSWIA